MIAFDVRFNRAKVNAIDRAVIKPGEMELGRVHIRLAQTNTDQRSDR